MGAHRVVIDRSIPFIKGVLEPFVETLYLTREEICRERLIEEAATILVVRSVIRCTQDLLEGTDVRFIATATAGFDHIDLDYCRQQGIAWSNVPACNAGGVAYWVFYALSRYAIERQLNWQDERVGIVGVGNVGKRVQAGLEAMGIPYLLCDPYRAEEEGTSSFVSLQEIAHRCSIITFHTPLTKEGKYPTHYMINASFLEQCRRKPHLLNAARGSIVKTDDLLQAIQGQQVSALSIDCWEGEPIVSEELRRSVAFATTHIAGFSQEGKRRASEGVVRAVLDFLGKSHQTLPKGEGGECVELEWQEGAYALEHLFLQSGQVLQDLANAWKEGSGDFESLRRSYPLHRETSAFYVKGVKEATRPLLRSLGFQL